MLFALLPDGTPASSVPCRCRQLTDHVSLRQTDGSVAAAPAAPAAAPPLLGPQPGAVAPRPAGPSPEPGMHHAASTSAVQPVAPPPAPPLVAAALPGAAAAAAGPPAMAFAPGTPPQQQIAEIIQQSEFVTDHNYEPVSGICASTPDGHGARPSPRAWVWRRNGRRARPAPPALGRSSRHAPRFLLLSWALPIQLINSSSQRSHTSEAPSCTFPHPSVCRS